MISIGISANSLVDDLANQPCNTKTYISTDYVDAIVTTGATPFVLPITTNEAVVEQYIANIDGLLLSGGQDVAPVFYQENPREKLGRVLPERDAFEYLLIKHALRKKMPILGICRGCQILNVYFGGTLYQDVSHGDFWVQHDQGSLPKVETHTVQVMKNTVLANIVGKETIMVNSFHHQIIKDVAAGFDVAAVAADGAIEYQNAEQFIFAVQWHPEMLAQTNQSMSELFKFFYRVIGKAK